MIQRVGIFFNPHKHKVFESVERLKQVLEGRGTEVSFVTSTESHDMNGDPPPDLLLVLGGDGSVLRSLPMALRWNVPVAGIHFGKFGFLTRFELAKVLEDPDCCLHGFCLSPRQLLRIIDPAQGVPEYALNDVVLHRPIGLNTLEFVLQVDGGYLEPVQADGVLISTPTGSTAYALSAGGAVIFPQAKVLQVTFLAPHTIAMRPLVLDAASHVTILVNGPRPMHLAVDGLAFDEVRQLSLTGAQQTFQLACPQEDTHPQILVQKLFLGKRG